MLKLRRNHRESRRTACMQVRFACERVASRKTTCRTAAQFHMLINRIDRSKTPLSACSQAGKPMSDINQLNFEAKWRC